MPDDNQGEIILYRTDDGRAEIQLRTHDGTVWLTQNEIAQLFDTTRQNVTAHIKNIYVDGELSPAKTRKKYLPVATGGVRKDSGLYNLSLILAVGFRIRSPRGVQFRQWATVHLSEYLVKGFVLNDEQLKDPGRSKYFDELLARIRDIRASEKMFYGKVRDIFALSDDYEARKNETEISVFFASVQNLLLYAITEHTAAELIVERADPHKLDMGVASYPGDRLRRNDALIAKNYLDDKELDGLNRLVVMFLDQAEFAVQRRQHFTLAYWQEATLNLLKANNLPVLKGAGVVSHKKMVEIVSQHYEEFDDNRRAAEAAEIDVYEAADFEQLHKEVEDKIAVNRSMTNKTPAQ